MLAATALAACTGCARAQAVPDADAEVPTTELSITMRDVEGRGAELATFTLTCDPVGGDLPSAIPACENLSTVTDPFTPVATDANCLNVIEGPGLITVRGTLDGTPVHAEFTQIDSCENHRFQRFLSTLGVS